MPRWHCRVRSDRSREGRSASDREDVSRNAIVPISDRPCHESIAVVAEHCLFGLCVHSAFLRRLDRS